METESGVLQNVVLVDHAEAAFTPEDKGRPSEFRAAISALSHFITIGRITFKAMTTSARLMDNYVSISGGISLITRTRLYSLLPGNRTMSLSLRSIALFYRSQRWKRNN